MAPLLGLALCACAPAPSEAPAGAPNVLLMSIDTLRADHLGYHGYGRPTSPRLDEFARSAVVFESAQASASWTLPTLASIFTSTYTSTHRCWDFATSLDDSFTTLTEHLLAQGYDTACVVSHIYCTPSYGLTQGFVHVDDALALPTVDPDLAVTSEAISDRGIRFLENKAGAPDGKPWFLWLHYFDPHGTYVPQPGFSELFQETEESSEETSGAGSKRRDPELDLYDGEIAYTDHHVGRVLDALEANGQARQTLVVLVADHGEEFGDHGGRDHGHSLFAELIRVPLAIRAPGIAARRVPELVRTVDLGPTLLDLAGLPPLTSSAGRSLRSIMEGGTLEARPALSEIRLNPRHAYEAVLDERYKLVRRLGAGGGRLFDLREDPLEKINLAPAMPEELERLTTLLDSLVQEAAQLGERFEHGPKRDLSPSELDALRKLGYLGDEEEEQ